MNFNKVSSYEFTNFVNNNYDFRKIEIITILNDFNIVLHYKFKINEIGYIIVSNEDKHLNEYYIKRD
jgi:hypothetical protein